MGQERPLDRPWFRTTTDHHVPALSTSNSAARPANSTVAIVHARDQLIGHVGSSSDGQCGSKSALPWNTSLTEVGKKVGTIVTLVTVYQWWWATTAWPASWYGIRVGSRRSVRRRSNTIAVKMLSLVSLLGTPSRAVNLMPLTCSSTHSQSPRAHPLKFSPTGTLRDFRQPVATHPITSVLACDTDRMSSPSNMLQTGP